MGSELKVERWAWFVFRGQECLQEEMTAHRRKDLKPVRRRWQVEPRQGGAWT